MKNYKILALAACLLTLAACDKEKETVLPGGLDASKPAVSSFSYDEANSGETAAAFTWDATAADAAGATSYTIELTTDLDHENPNNASIIQIVPAPATAQVIKGLKKNAFYYARIRANYEGYYFSGWDFLGSAEKPLAVCVGKGASEASFGAPQNLAASNVNDHGFKLAWDAVAFCNSYVVEYKPATSGTWEVIEGVVKPAYEVDGLVAATAYDVRVKAIKGETASEYTAISVTTAEPSGFDPHMGTVEAFMAFMSGEAANASAVSEFTLEADIDVTGKEIATVENFKGILDGKGHAIKGLSLSGPLFQTLSGTVRDVTFEGNVTMTIAEENIEVGHPLALLAIISTGNVVNCVNKASVSLVSTAKIGSPVVAGLVAYQNGGEFSGNKNYGEIKLVHAGTYNAAIEGFNRKPFSVVGGLVGVIVDATASGCQNEGAVSVSCTDVPKIEARHYVGGIIGTPQGSRVIGCINRGAISADFTDATKSSAKQVWVGGIIGGRNGDEKTVDGAYVENCENFGDCTLIAENSVNNYLAGIGGQATVEATGNNYTSDSSTIQKIVNCHNHGKLTKKGAGGCRLGGISGGAATLENCSNDGDILVEGISTAGAVGGLVGYPTQPYHPVTGCKNTGKMTATCDVVFAMGGLFGQGGNTNQNYADCTANCVMEAPASVLAGMILGTAKTIASGKAIVYGTAAAPFKVGGSVKGVKLDGSNFTSLLVGDGGVTAGGEIDLSNVVLE